MWGKRKRCPNRGLYSVTCKRKTLNTYPVIADPPEGCHLPVAYELNICSPGMCSGTSPPDVLISEGCLQCAGTHQPAPTSVVTEAPTESCRSHKTTHSEGAVAMKTASNGDQAPRCVPEKRLTTHQCNTIKTLRDKRVQIYKLRIRTELPSLSNTMYKNRSP